MPLTLLCIIYRHTFNSIFLLTRHSSVFPNPILKLKALDQLQSAGDESLLTRDIT